MKLALSVLGLMVAAFGGALAWTILRAPVVHPSALLYVAIGVFGVGLLLVDGVAAALASALTALGMAVGKYLPWMKGGDR